MCEVYFRPTMKTIVTLVFALSLTVSTFADPYAPGEDPRVFNPVTAFGKAPMTDLKAALQQSVATNKRVLLFYWESKAPSPHPGLDFRYFAEYRETKKLLNENFILVLLDKDHPDVAPYMPAGENVEKPKWVLIDTDGIVLRGGRANYNADDGLRIVKDLISIPR